MKPIREKAIKRNVEEIEVRIQFILKLAKALLSFGAPSHRIESHLDAAAEHLDMTIHFVYLPALIIVSCHKEGKKNAQTYFVRASGKIALSKLHQVHVIYRDVVHDNIGAESGSRALRSLLRSPPTYPFLVRCSLAFICAAIMCALSFGGSITDVGISGMCAFLLQYLGLDVAKKSALYGNVYEISISMLVSFVARALSNIRGNIFCYSAISSSGVILILPGFTILTSALELMSKNLFCGSVRLVYAIIYTLFLGFSLTIGSDLYHLFDREARHAFYHNAMRTNMTYLHGTFSMLNGTTGGPDISVGTLGVGNNNLGITSSTQVIKGCLRFADAPWWKQPVPWWSFFYLVPLYSFCSSLSNLQSIRSYQIVVMVFFSCCSWAVNRVTNIILPKRADLASASGAFVIGILGNMYSRIFRGTAFTSMVTGVLFLVPSSIAQGGALTQSYESSEIQYSTGFSLALRMISVASGVTIGLFVSQLVVYLAGHRKNAAHFAF